MSRSSIWNGTEWVSMTGGVGDGGGGEPGDDYLRLDGSNNNPPPNNYLRQNDADARYQTAAQADAKYLQLTGGAVSGTVRAAALVSDGNIEWRATVSWFSNVELDGRLRWHTGGQEVLALHIGAVVAYQPITFHNTGDLEQKVDGHYTSGNGQVAPWVVVSGSAPTGTNVGPGCLWFELP